MFTVIKGSFVPRAGRPDGDSVRFRPDDPNPIYRLRRRGVAPKLNENSGTIQLRFEGIDTMESRALVPYSTNATASNLALLGFDEDNEAPRGYILSNQLGPNGRPIAFVFEGETDLQDGSEVFLDIDDLERSVNYQQVILGHAYPLFYDTLYRDLREKIADATRSARNQQIGVWVADLTQIGVHYSGPASLRTMEPIFPKLWRRIDKYSRNNDIINPDSIVEFKTYLESIREERVFVLSDMNNTGFDDLVSVDDDLVKLSVEPEDLVVISI